MEDGAWRTCKCQVCLQSLKWLLKKYQQSEPSQLSMTLHLQQGNSWIPPWSKGSLNQFFCLISPISASYLAFSKLNADSDSMKSLPPVLIPLLDSTFQEFEYQVEWDKHHSFIHSFDVCGVLTYSLRHISSITSSSPSPTPPPQLQGGVFSLGVYSRNILIIFLSLYLPMR